MAFSVSTLAQDDSATITTGNNNTATTTMNSTATTSLTPFSGSKGFRKFSIGINAGALNPAVAIGGSNDFTNPQTTLGYGANIKYQLTHYLALQADFVRGNLKGNQDDPLWEDGGPQPNRNVTEFDTELHYAISGGGVFTFGNINWLSARSRIVPYISAGAGLAQYDVRIVPRGSSQLVDFPANSPITEFFVPVGLGLKFRLSNALNLDLGYRMNFTDGDNLDGARILRASYHKDKFQYGFLGLEFAFGNKANEQLMFHNPAAQLNNHIKTQIDRLQTQIDTLNARLSVVDTDGDGVADQFDKEPGTPSGCPVDFRGVTRDTDGDGVPDCNDKQLITPTECQPVNAEGVGTCPPPPCCDSLRMGTGACDLGDLPSISFRGSASGVNSDARLMLATVASKVKSSANCTITITGYPAASKASQALCNRRLEAVKNHLVENEGISSDRITTNCEVGGGDANTVDIRGN